ncbi:Putative cytoplasmic protein [Salmonella enterica subsp. enterica serovar Senftenberg str. A4-543]|uniref:2-oxoadipate dioxygenase/decarboxylase n=1 Tax=Salmonella enterica subsp. enterica serovar Senftenberg str. A4-543 TaxID=913082 RepID=G5QZV6_SALSE|nr:Putative cytoplasmic protein [Salmonella enterica subsp. enterica serovar Senftenberg str. A4-543]
MANTITADEIREHFSQAMSAMYQQEVPQYGTLLELVADVNLAVLENNPKLHEQLANADELARLNVERHGAMAPFVLAPQTTWRHSCWHRRRTFYLASDIRHHGDVPSKLLRSLSGGRACALHGISSH